MLYRPKVRLVRLYQSDKGIWRYEIERNGAVSWSSLNTRDEAVARSKYNRLAAKWSDESGVQTLSLPTFAEYQLAEQEEAERGKMLPGEMG